MSKIRESFFEGLSCCATLLILIGVLCSWNYIFDFNWSLSTNKIEKWISLDKGHGSYHTKGLDGEWSAFTNGWITMQGKIREPLNGNSESYDFAFKVNARLTPPKLETGMENKIVDSYLFSFTFYFIDEDGFIIHKIRPNESLSIEHEKHDNYLKWTLEKYPYKQVDVSSVALSKNMIPKEIAKRAHKIIYSQKLEAVIRDKEQRKSTFQQKFDNESIDQFNKYGAIFFSDIEQFETENSNQNNKR